MFLLKSISVYLLLIHNDIVFGLREYSKEDLANLKQQVKDVFYHAYNGYLNFAFPYDELRPLSCDGIDTWGSYSLTLIDALDTLAIMGNYTEFARVVELVTERANFDININVSVFETNIRIVGGLLSAHLFSERAGLNLPPGWPCNGPLLRLAEDVARRLLPAFDTDTGMPFGTVNLRYGVPMGETPVTCTAGVGTYIVEFGTLSRLTGDPIYEEVALRALRSLYKRKSNIGLFGNHIDTKTGIWTAQDSGIGAGVDSYFEYLVKGAILFQRPELLAMFNEIRGPIDRYLKRDDWYLWVSMHKGQVTLPVFQSLEAFWPGVLSLVGDVSGAMKSLHNYHQVWKQYGFLPEFYNIVNSEVGTNRESYPLRPELIESVMYLHRATGDPYLLDVGQDILNSIQHSARTPCGYATIKNVVDHSQEDRMESFFLAETTKYLYLLFDTENFIHDDGNQGKLFETDAGKLCVLGAGGYIFNTEAHPVDVSALHCCVSENLGDLNLELKRLKQTPTPWDNEANNESGNRNEPSTEDDNDNDDNKPSTEDVNDNDNDGDDIENVDENELEEGKDDELVDVDEPTNEKNSGLSTETADLDMKIDDDHDSLIKTDGKTWKVHGKSGNKQEIVGNEDDRSYKVEEIGVEVDEMETADGTVVNEFNAREGIESVGLKEDKDHTAVKGVDELARGVVEPRVPRAPSPPQEASSFESNYKTFTDEIVSKLEAAVDRYLSGNKKPEAALLGTIERRVVELEKKGGLQSEAWNSEGRPEKSEIDRSVNEGNSNARNSKGDSKTEGVDEFGDLTDLTPQKTGRNVDVSSAVDRKLDSLDALDRKTSNRKSSTIGKNRVTVDELISERIHLIKTEYGNLDSLDRDTLYRVLQQGGQKLRVNQKKLDAVMREELLEVKEEMQRGEEDFFKRLENLETLQAKLDSMRDGHERILKVNDHISTLMKSVLAKQYEAGDNLSPEQSRRRVNAIEVEMKKVIASQRSFDQASHPPTLSDRKISVNSSIAAPDDNFTDNDEPFGANASGNYTRVNLPSGAYAIIDHTVLNGLKRPGEEEKRHLAEENDTSDTEAPTEPDPCAGLIAEPLRLCQLARNPPPVFHPQALYAKVTDQLSLYTSRGIWNAHYALMTCAPQGFFTKFSLRGEFFEPGGS